MKILFASAEVAPIVKVGGLADVAGALPKAIKKLGHDIRIVMPAYQVIDREKFPMKLIAQNIPVVIGKDKETVKIYQTTLPQSDVPVYLLENKKYLTKDGVYYEVTSFANVQRFLFFSKAVLAMASSIFGGLASEYQPEIIHCQDWHTSAIPLFLKLEPLVEKLKTLLTVHNLGMQGQWNYEETLKFLDLRGDEAPSLKKRFPGPYGDDFNTIQQGMLNADIINTVSPTYAQEILTDDKFGQGLTPTAQKRKADFYGILNGIDTEIWNPAKDPAIRANYTLRSIKRKQENKLALQETLGLRQAPEIPLLGMVTRLTEQKGIDLVVEALREARFRFDSLGSPLQVVFLGTGDEKLAKILEALAKEYPNRVSANIRFDARLARQIYAGADMFLMPSRFEPCGLCQMIAMRYGTIPIVRATGGLKDTVRDVKIKRRGLLKKVEGTGFVFRDFEVLEFIRVLRRALDFYKNKKAWQQVQANVMSQDFSWGRSAGEYVGLYIKLIGDRHR